MQTLAFTVGTRKKPVQLKFVVDVYTTDNITIPIDSNVSEKIISMTFIAMFFIYYDNIILSFFLSFLFFSFFCRLTFSKNEREPVH
jgi:hypothetical protein